MDDKIPNPRAFPVSEVGEVTANCGAGEYGMRLRDWFAGMAVEGICARGVWGKALDIASEAYEIADAMLKERVS